MTYAQLGDLRIATIYRLDISGDKDGFIPTDMLDCGLHLDARCADGEHWFAIAKIAYNSKEDSYDLESIGSRLMSFLTADNLEDTKYLVEYAYKLMRKEWKKLHPNED